MWEKFKKWIAKVGDFLWRFTRTTAAKFLDQYGPIAMECVKDAALRPGTGREKFNYAAACMAAKLPSAAAYLIDTAIQAAYAVYKEESAQGN